MMKQIVLPALLALGACASQTPYVVERVAGAREVLVRWNEATIDRAAVDAQAQRVCGGAADFVTVERRHDGFNYARYRCGEG